MECWKVGLVRGELDVEEIVEDLKRGEETGEAGAIVVFVGVVKGRVDGEEVELLEYEALEEKAVEALEKIAREICGRDGVYGVRIYHRVGSAAPGEDVVYVAVYGRGREDAFSNAWEIMDRVKHEAYVWKREVRRGGSYWVVGEGERIPDTTDSRSSEETGSRLSGGS